jgi:2'-5' RNA ligase
MHRLFVALRPPPSMRTALLATMGGIPGARWQDDDQLHLTLRFIGDVDRHQAADIDAALAAIHHPPFSLRLSGIGAFDKKGRIDSLWAGVTPQDEVKGLHAAIDRALARAGVARDDRAFVPHITLARFARTAAPPLPLPVADMTPPPLEALFDVFHLYESELGNGGSSYTNIERYPLRR